MKINLNEFEELFDSFRSHGDGQLTKVIQRLVLVTEASAGAIWHCSEETFTPTVYHSTNESTKVAFSQTEHHRFLKQAIDQKRMVVVNTRVPGGEADAPLLFHAPLTGTPPLVLELVFPANHAIVNSPPGVEELRNFCEWFNRKLAIPCSKSNPSSGSELQNAVNIASAASSKVKTFGLREFSQFNDALHQSIDMRLTCANIANEARSLLDCDRVSVLWKRRGRFRLASISGQPSINRRSNLVLSLERLAAEVLRAKSSFWYPSEQEAVPQIKSLLDDYLTISATRSLVIQPIFSKSIEPNDSPNSSGSASPELIGGIVYEHCRETWKQGDFDSVLNLATQHCGNALRNAKEHSSLFLYPVWKWLGKSKLLAAPGAMPKLAFALLLAIGCGLFLALWQTPFYVSASGVLVPQQRRFIFPKTTGEVIAVSVTHGQQVKANDTLAILKSEELQLRIADVAGRIETLEQRKNSIERSKFQNANATATASTVDDSLGALQAEIDSLDRQLTALQQMASNLNVVSPMDGQVITWDVEQKLLGRTVMPQHELLEVANVDGPWQVEIDVEDRRIEHVLTAWQQPDHKPLKVQFSLAADPSKSFVGTVSNIANAMQVSESNQSILRVTVDVDESSLQLKQARTGAFAKIYTGESTTIGYLWLHEIPQALHRYVFFYFAQ